MPYQAEKLIPPEIRLTCSFAIIRFESCATVRIEQHAVTPNPPNQSHSSQNRETIVSFSGLISSHFELSQTYNVTINI